VTDVSTTCEEVRVKSLDSEDAIFRVKSLDAQAVETSVTNGSPSGDSNHSDDLFQSR